MKLTINKKPTEVHFTADMHFHHGNIIKFCNRPYKNLDEMHEALIENWNQQVLPDDTVFHLGDFSFKGSPQKVEEIVKYLNGNIIFIVGNHERDLMKSNIRNTHMIEERIELNVSGFNALIVLDHYPMLAWNGSNRGSIQLFGHVHGGLSNKGKIDHRWNQMDVGVDATRLYRPINLEEVQDTLTKQFLELQNKQIA